jgi:hypothetical protein
VLLGQESYVLREHREDALEHELHDVALARRVLLLEASVHLGHEVGDLPGDLRDVDDLRQRTRHPRRTKERESFAVLGQIVECNGEPGRRAVPGNVVEVQVTLVREDDVLWRRVELDACAKEVLPRIVEHHVVLHHVDHDAPRGPPEGYQTRRALRALNDLDHGRHLGVCWPRVRPAKAS